MRSLDLLEQDIDLELDTDKVFRQSNSPEANRWPLTHVEYKREVVVFEWLIEEGAILDYNAMAAIFGIWSARQMPSFGNHHLVGGRVVTDAVDIVLVSTRLL